MYLSIGVGTAIGTFKGPFSTLTNGYICAWTSLIVSAVFSAMTGSLPDVSHTVRYGPNGGGNLSSARTDENSIHPESADAISDPTVPRYNPPMGAEQL